MDFSFPRVRGKVGMGATNPYVLNDEHGTANQGLRHRKFRT